MTSTFDPLLHLYPLNPFFNSFFLYIFVFASPLDLLFPAFLFDRRFSRFWAAMNRVDTAPDAHIKLISVSGGIRDEFIEEGWTVTPRARINAHAAAMERVWLTIYLLIAREYSWDGGMRMIKSFVNERML